MKTDTIKSATRLFLALVSLLILQGCASMQGAAHYDSNSGCLPTFRVFFSSVLKSA